MLIVMDAFAQAVEEARVRLQHTEGRTISNRELARRAGVAETTLGYNLSPKRAAEGRRVSPKLIRALAQVLPVSEEELTRAAQVAAGYQTREEDLPDLGGAVVRYLNREDVTPENKARLRSRLMEILAEEMRKSADQGTHNGQ